ncbi:hypothetical protein FSP39_010804 [Pinctada imbricata]|uniref:Sushi domain-containing protein n=1 Tax=Pinctada imbricata TaxID=66713 RepID=A0AA88XLX7_PINIB|nr:hypothetical protein FSP39_010804 [Pinctada imbricata]
MGNVTLLHQGISYSSSVQIAYDWLSRTIYWTDELYNWIAVQPVDTDDRTMFKVILHENMNNPYAIAVDPLKGLLFWSEHSAGAVIERSTLTGENRRVILTGVSWVPDIVTDTASERLYWIDIGRNSLESAKYDGTDRRLVRRSTNVNLYMNGVTLYQDVVCISQYQLSIVECLDKNSGAVVWSQTFGDQQPWAVEVYDKDLQKQVPHACETSGCSHFCVNTPTGSQCLCKEGYELSTDNKTCEIRHNLFGKGLIIGNGTDLCMLDVRVITSHMSETRCFYTWKSNITHLAVDAHKHLVFFTDDDSNNIIKLDVSTNTTEVIASFSNISGLAYDWISNDVYWSEADLGEIKVTPTDGKMLLETIVHWDIKNPSYLTIDPYNFTIFWISTHTGIYKIEGGSLDGLTRWTVVSSPVLDNPTGLFFDTTYDRLFWINQGEMRSIRPDGTDMLTFHSVGSRHDTLVYKDYALATDGREQILVSNLHSTSATADFSINITHFGTVNTMAIFDSSTQRIAKGPCEDNDGGCEHICIPEANSKYSCRCTFGFRLSSDNHNCTSTPILKDFVLVVDLTHGLFYQVSLTDANIVAVDVPFPNYPKHAIYDPTHHYVYWSDFNTNRIMRSTINGTNKSVVFNSGMYMPNGLIMDPSTGNIYYSASSLDAFLRITSYIGVLNPHSGKHKVLISQLDRVSQLVIHPERGWLFWIDTGNVITPPYIGRSSMDGDDRIYFIANNIVSPSSLAIDFEGECLYWADSHENVISSVDFNGTDPRLLIHDPNADIAQIAISGSHVFYTATNRQFITKVNKHTGTVASWMNKVPDFGRLESIDINDDKKVPVSSKCSVDNGMCSTFCLPTPFGRTCGCEDGTPLMADERTCWGVKKCPGRLTNGRLSASCTGYLGVSCSFVCESGFTSVTSDHLHCTESGNWDRNLRTLCQKMTVNTNTLARKMTDDYKMTTGTIIGVVIGVGVLLIIIGVICLFMFKRKRGMFAHAKFINSPNIHLNPGSAENVSANSDDRANFKSRDFNDINVSVASNPS